MTEYITIVQVDELLGADWAAEDKKARAVLMANTWLTQKRLPAFDSVPDAVVQAGAELAREAAAGRLYQAREVGLIGKSVNADGVSSSKTYSSAGGRSVSAGEAFALALLSQWLGTSGQTCVVRA